eukprot:TRINITY_DN6989_c0_g1_i1.p1 TRINITY_DN6989_c0_g1~~TRINITY_DN6989_c0_g1_i1.p1  ORF type:complete len:506 (-),score=97.51 TRINITY_DN6989_c0_g1_i1:65-1582(-)
MKGPLFKAVLASTVLTSWAVRTGQENDAAPVKTVTIRNRKPGDKTFQEDANGNPMDLHDGSILKVGDVYYWYGMGYTDCPDPMAKIEPTGCRGIYEAFGTGEDLHVNYTKEDTEDPAKLEIMKRSRGACGFRTDHRINVYSSTDLQTWTPHGDILPIGDRPVGVYFRPKIIFNNKYKEFIVWVNVLPYDKVKCRPPGKDTSLDAYPYAGFLVAKSKTPTGAFEIVTKKAGTAVQGGGDFGMMVDGDDAYLAYDAWGDRKVRPTGDHSVRVEKLDEHFYDSLYFKVEDKSLVSSDGPLSPHDHEAPAMFKREGKTGTWYYVTYGHTCCFCKEGSNAIAQRSKHPLGPYEKVSNNVMPKDVKSQQNAVFVVETSSGPEFIWSGDQWKTSPDGLKSHDFQYWSPMEFDDEDKPLQPDWKDEFTLNLVTGKPKGEVVQNSYPIGTVDGAAAELPNIVDMPDVYVPGNDGYGEFTSKRTGKLLKMGWKIAKAAGKRAFGIMPSPDTKECI